MISFFAFGALFVVSEGCACSGVTNEFGIGGPDCAVEWCYVSPGACEDGQISGALGDQEWSFAACKGADSLTHPPTREPTPQPTECVNDEEWRSSTGTTCAVYERNLFCENGELGRGWSPTLGVLSDYANAEGVDASHACCACKPTLPPTPNPTPTLTASPSPEPTTSPTPQPSEGCDESFSGDGRDYRGCQTRTRSGRTCQKWTAQWPHRHTRTPANFPDSGLGDHNYCRNPRGGGSTMWCYTTDRWSRFELCDPLN